MVVLAARALRFVVFGASEAAYEFRGTSIPGCELWELQRPYALGFFDRLRGGALRGIASRTWSRETLSALRIP